ncbi:hypothetical protein JCGZ_23936 [Jatropha curcas]|uniref:PGG domain-containing protein n=1 Tax=Jatropha curcas TaxID=180498 RepID=A0A067K0G5_JATCU|nr:hypothetical protein JCGZ_23936 [Jatropha curcas]
MSIEGLEILDDDDTSALCIAAETGSMRIVDLVLTKNSKLVSIPVGVDLPVNIACRKGFRELTWFLYSKTPFELLLPENGTLGAELLHVSFFSKMFDFSLALIQRCPRLAVTRTIHKTTPLIELSSMSELFPSSNRLSFWKRRIYSGLKQIYDMKLTHIYALQVIRCIFEGTSITKNQDIIKKGIDEALFTATESGIVEIVIEILKANPSIITTRNTLSRGIIEYAIEYRQEKVFSIIYAVGEWKGLLINSFDGDGNNTLHMAGMLAPAHRLAHISSPALQMQRELQWYKEVESIVDPALKQYVNEEEYTPSQLFTKSHKELKEEGEKWMKGIATSSTVVGALIITIMFTTAFTVPGGNFQDTGFPIFLHKKAFKVFIVADAISLFASSTSVLMFLGVLTSRYAEEDFLESLPRKMIMGLSTLFFSIAAMMISFCATLIIMLDGDLKLIIPIILLASIPVTVFIFLQFPLLVEIFVSTYRPRLFDRKMKYWY